MDTFLEVCNLENELCKPVTSKETESITKNLPTKKIPGPDGFTREVLLNILRTDTNLQTLQKNWRILPKSL